VLWRKKLVSKIKSNFGLYLYEIGYTYNQLRLSVMVHDAHMKNRYLARKGVINVYNSSKMHILYHLVEDIHRFGSPINYVTKKGEQFNKFIRECLFRTNMHSLSRNAAVAFSKRFVARHILADGSWQVAGQSSPVNPSPKFLIR
jgi:hypothetical protein